MICSWSSILEKNIAQFKIRFAELYKILENDFNKIFEELKKTENQFFKSFYEDEFIKNNFQNSNDENFQKQISLQILNSVFKFWQFSFSKNNNIIAKENNIFLHSSYNPVAESARLFQNENSKINNLRTEKNSQDKNARDENFITKNLNYIFAGIGIGYAPIEKAKLQIENSQKCKSQNQFQNCDENKFQTFDKNHFFIIEPNPFYLIASMTILDWTPIFSLQNCVIICGAPADQAAILVERLCTLEKTKIITNNALTNHEQNWFKTFFTLIERNKQKQIINSNTLEKFSTLWQKNSAKNLHHFINASGINIYKNILQNKIPSIVIAAGPTLQDAIPYLKKIQDKAIFIAVDTALRTLLKNNIEPDFVILIDPQYYAACHLQGLSSPSSVLITESSVYPSVMRFNCRKKVFCESLFPLGKYFEENLVSEKSFGKLIAGGSVSTSCFDFAKMIGSSKIFFAGLDLGYPEKMTHIKGSTFEEKTHSTSTKLHSAESLQTSILFSSNNEISFDYENNKIITDSKMKLFAWWFESQIAKENSNIAENIIKNKTENKNENQQKYFTLSKKSLKIPGVEFFDINELLNFPTIFSITNFSKIELIKRAENENLKNNFQQNFDTKKEVELLKNETSQITKENFEKLLTNLKNQFAKILTLSKNGLSICENILHNAALDKNFAEQNALKKFNELQKIDAEILTSSAKQIVALVFPTEKQLEKILLIQENTLQNFSSQILQNIFKSKIIYEQLISSIEKYLKYL